MGAEAKKKELVESSNRRSQDVVNYRRSVGRTYCISPVNTAADMDCLKRGNDQNQLCCNCDSCKAELCAKPEPGAPDLDPRWRGEPSQNSGDPLSRLRPSDSVARGAPWRETTGEQTQRQRLRPSRPNDGGGATSRFRRRRGEPDQSRGVARSVSACSNQVRLHSLLTVGFSAVVNGVNQRRLAGGEISRGFVDVAGGRWRWKSLVGIVQRAATLESYEQKRGTRW